MTKDEIQLSYKTRHVVLCNSKQNYLALAMGLSGEDEDVKVCKFKFWPIKIKWLERNIWHFYSVFCFSWTWHFSKATHLNIVSLFMHYVNVSLAICLISLYRENKTRFIITVFIVLLNTLLLLTKYFYACLLINHSFKLKYNILVYPTC